MKEKIKLGIIGLGNRGSHLAKNIFGDMQDVEIRMICDLSESNIEKAQKFFKEEKNVEVAGTTKWLEVVNCDEIDGVVISTSWALHVEMAITAMKKGKYAAPKKHGCAAVTVVILAVILCLLLAAVFIWKIRSLCRSRHRRKHDHSAHTNHCPYRASLGAGVCCLPGAGGSLVRCWRRLPGHAAPGHAGGVCPR